MIYYANCIIFGKKKQYNNGNCKFFLFLNKCLLSLKVVKQCGCLLYLSISLVECGVGVYILVKLNIQKFRLPVGSLNF